MRYFLLFVISFAYFCIIETNTRLTRYKKQDKVNILNFINKTLTNKHKYKNYNRQESFKKDIHTEKRKKPKEYSTL